jgi:hypothetical protein
MNVHQWCNGPDLPLVGREAAQQQQGGVFEHLTLYIQKEPHPVASLRPSPQGEGNGAKL